MILLNPSRTIQQQTNIDFDLLSQLLTTVLEKNHKRKINIVARVYKSKITGASFCCYEDGYNFLIELDTSKRNPRYLFSSILHELRHCIQKNLFNYSLDTDNMKTWRAYWFSREEIDARKMERLTTQVLKSYNSMVEIGNLFTKLNLNTVG